MQTEAGHGGRRRFACLTPNSDLPEVRKLLEATDLLIAGPYVAAQATDGRAWRGSANQEFVFLSGRDQAQDLDSAAKLPVIEVKSDGRLLDWTGIPAAMDIPAESDLLALRNFLHS